MVIKKYCFEKIGLFDENFLFHDDWDIWVRFIKSDLKTGLVPNTDPLWVYRIRSDSLFHSTYKQKNGLMDKYYAFKKHKAEVFKFNPYLKKVYGEKLFFIGKEVFVIPGCKFLGIKILLESQICDFNAKKITEQVKKLLKKLSYGKS